MLHMKNDFVINYCCYFFHMIKKIVFIPAYWKQIVIQPILLWWPYNKLSHHWGNLSYSFLCTFGSVKTIYSQVSIYLFEIPLCVVIAWGAKETPAMPSMSTMEANWDCTPNIPCCLVHCASVRTAPTITFLHGKREKRKCSHVDCAWICIAYLLLLWLILPHSWDVFITIIVVVITDAPSGRGFIMMARQRLRVSQVQRLLIPTGEPHKFLCQTKYAMFLTELPRGILFSFVVRKEFWHC